MSWKRTTEIKPPLNEKVLTKIDDEIGIRNEQIMFFDGNLWWTASGKDYVYYTPTHWLKII